MSVDVSTLQIKVTSDGIKEASSAIGGLSTSANNAEKRVDKLTSTIQKLVGVQQTATAIATGYNTALSNSTTATTGSSTATSKLLAAVDKLNDGMTKLVSKAGDANGFLKKISEGMKEGSAATDKSTASIRKNTDAMRDAHGMARGLTGSMGALWLTYGNFATVAIGAAIGASFIQVVKAGKDVENTLEGIRVRGGESYEAVDKLRGVVTDLGKGVYGPQEVAKALNDLVMAGLSAEQAATGVKDALNLATVGGTSIEKSATTLVQVGTALGYTAEGFNRVADVIAKSAAVSMSSVESLSEAFKSGSAVGKLYGASLESIGTSLAALSNLGIQGSAAGTSLKNFYKELSVDTEKLRKTLKDMKMVPSDLQDANGKFLDIVTVIGKLNDGLNNLKPDQQLQALQRLSNERGMKTVIELLDLYRQKTKDGANELVQMNDRIANSYGYAAQGAAQMAQTVDAQFKAVKNTLMTTFSAAFTEIQPQLLVFSTKLREVFGSDSFKSAIQSIAITLANLALAIAENADKLQYLVTGVLALKGLSIVVGAIGAVTAALGGLTTMFGIAGAAATAFQIKLGAIAIALTLAGAAWTWYASRKAEADAKTQAAFTNLEEYNKSLNNEAERLEKINEKLRSGISLKEADAAATQSQALAMAEKNKTDMSSGALAAKTAADDALNKYKTKMGDNPSAQVASGLKVLEENARKAGDALEAAKNKGREMVAETALGITRANAAARENQRLIANQQAAAAASANAMAGDGVLSGKIDKAGIAKANAELEKYRNTMVELNAALKEQQDLNTSMRVLGPDYEKLGKGAREIALAEAELAAIRERSATGQAKATDAARAGHLQEIIAIAQKVKEWENLNQVQKRYNDLQKEEDGKLETRIKNVREEADNWKYKAETYGEVKGAAEQVALAEMQRALAEQEGLMATMGGNDAIQKRIDKLKELIAEQQRLADNKSAYGQLQAADDARKSFDKLFDKGRALEFGNDFAQSFGKVGKAIDGAGKSMDKFWRRQSAVGEARDKLAKAENIDAKERAKMSDMLTLRETRNNVEMYADMTAAAKSFFSEKTAAYKVMDAVERGLRVVQLGMAMEEAAIKMGLIQGVTLAKAGAATKEMVIEKALTADSVAASGIKAEASMVAGVAKAFEQLGVWGFVGAAAIIAFLVAMGVSGGGGGGSMPDISKMRQEKQGTGTVLGDDTAKSESISHALDAIKDNTSLGLEHSGRMLMALRSIDNGIKSMAVAVAGTTGLRGTAADQKAAGVGSSSSFLGFSKSSTTLLDSGLTFNQARLADLMNGGSIGVSGYQDIERKKSSFFGLSKSSSTSRTLSGVDSDLQRQIDLTIRNLASGTLEAATALGAASGTVSRQLQDFVIDLGDISLKGLSGDDIEKELAAAFGKLGDQMANAVMPGFREFQRLGEGGFDTLVRLANGVEVAKKELDNLGVTMIAYQDVLNKQGDVDTEIIRQSIALKESGSNVADMLMAMDGNAQDLVDTYKKLVDLRGSLRAMGLATDVSNAMLRGAASLDELLSNVGSFMDGFYTDAEKQAVKVSKLREQFASLGVAMPTTTAGFRSLVENLMRGGERTQDLASRVLALSDAFLEVADAAKEAHDASVETARDALSEAYDRESSALQDTIDKMKGFIDSLKEFKDSLIMGDQSPLSTTEKYVTALAKYNETYQKAMGGDSKAIEEFQGVAQQLLNFSREMYASGDQYTSDFQNVLKNIDEVMGVADGQIDTATQQLNAMKDAVKTLIDIDTTVKTVAETLAKLQGLTSGTVTVDGSHANGLSSVPFDGYIAELHKGERVLTADENKAYNMDYSRYTSNSNDALVAEIKALRAEVVSLKESNSSDANRIIGANYDANERNAQDVVEGVKSAAEDSAYVARTQPVLN